jgi:hypothetical protein
VLKALVMRNFIFRDITPCSPLKINGRLGGTCCFHLQCRRISQARNQHKVGSKQSFPPETSVDLQRTTRCYNPADKTSSLFYCTPHWFTCLFIPNQNLLLLSKPVLHRVRNNFLHIILNRQHKDLFQKT